MAKDKIIPILKNELRIEGKNNPQDYFFVSDIEEPCDVKLWNRLHGTKSNNLTAEQNLIFKQGDEIHRLLVTAFMESKEIHLVSAEVFVDLCIVHGRCDAIITFNHDKEIYVVEIKSVNDYAMKFIPRRSHVLQLQTYLYGLGIKSGFLLYYGKGTQKLKEIPIKANNEQIKKMLKELAYKKDFILKTKNPGKPDTSKWDYLVCDWCQFSDNCIRKVKKLNKTQKK